MKKETAHFLQSFNRLVQNFSAIKRNVKKLLPTPKSGANLMPKLNEDRGAVRISTFGAKQDAPERKGKQPKGRVSCLKGTR